MANELNMSFSLNFSKGGVVLSRSPGGLQITVAGVDAMHGSQNIGTGAENIVQGDIGTCGVVWFYNLDATNYVELGYDDTGFVACCKIPPAQWRVWTPPNGVTQIQARANSGAIFAEYVIVEV